MFINFSKNLFKKGLYVAFLIISIGFTNAYADNVKSYKEGEHYKIVNDTLTPKKEVREFFSFWCGHCFALQEPYRLVSLSLVDGASFIESPVGLLGGPMGVRSQYAHALATLNGIGHEFDKALFNKMHIDGDLPESDSFYRDLLASLGIPNNKYDSEINSFAIIGMVSNTDRLVDLYKLDAVPELVVNGRYMVKQESVKTVAELSDLINYLLVLDDKK